MSTFERLKSEKCDFIFELFQKNVFFSLDSFRKMCFIPVVNLGKMCYTTFIQRRRW